MYILSPLFRSTIQHGKTLDKADGWPTGGFSLNVIELVHLSRPVRSRILPLPSDAIAISLLFSLLTKGDYFLALDGLTSSGNCVPAAHF